MIALMLLGCGSVFDGSYLIEYEITDADEAFGLVPGDKFQAVADLMSTGANTAIVDVDGAVYQGSLANYELEVDQWSTVRAQDGDCEYEIVDGETITATFTSYDTFSGRILVEQDVESSGCGFDDASYSFEADLAGVRILRGAQVDDAVLPLYE